MLEQMVSSPVLSDVSQQAQQASLLVPPAPQKSASKLNAKAEVFKPTEEFKQKNEPSPTATRVNQIEATPSSPQQLQSTEQYAQAANACAAAPIPGVVLFSQPVLSASGCVVVSPYCYMSPDNTRTYVASAVYYPPTYLY